MNRRPATSSLGPLMSALAALTVAAPVTHAFDASGSWTQWGGPTRDFCLVSPQLADSWPSDGPPKVWSRPLGQGHSAILASDGVLYTMYRRDEQDVVIALKADTGETAWEFAYDAPMKPNMMLEFGPGPHSTPLLVGDRLYTLSAVVQLHCLDRKTGKVIWKHDLMEEMSAGLAPRGYGASPIAYKDWIIVKVGAKDAGMVAFRQDNGEVAWKSAGMKTGYTTPVVARINNEDHLIVTSGADRIGLNPENGEIRWQTSQDQESAAIMSTPVFLPPDKVFFTCAYGSGSYMVQIVPHDGKYEAKELWHEKKMKVQHQSAVPAAGLLCGSSGDFGPAFLMGLDPADGKVAWRERSFSKANVLKLNDKLIILDEDGNLALATPTATGVTIHSRAPVLQNRSWTVPTLVGSRLYVRDYHNIMALELGKVASAATTGSAGTAGASGG